jgi:hypothetical protein
MTDLSDDRRIAPAPRALYALLAAYVALAWLAFGADAIGPSWRECDTQAIARSLAFEDFDLLRPRVDWRGDTTGEVECECPLYQGLVALLLRAVGDVDWPGRLVSLLATAWLAASWWRLLARCASTAGAWLGVAALLGSPQVAFFGTRVMPDATSLALGAAGLLAFVRFLDEGRARSLAWATAWTALAALAKPTALQFVALQAAFAFALQPQRLRELRLWAAFALVVALVAAWLLHARALGLSTGLTFGVTFGDVKSPGLDHLARPRLWLMLASATWWHGAGPVGLLAAALLLARRRLARLDLLFAGVVAVGLVGSFRYSHAVSMGPQYHAMSALFGAWLAGRAVAVGGRGARAALAAAAVVVAAIAYAHEPAQRPGRAPTAHDATAAALRAEARPGELVAIRGPKPAHDAFWRRPNNCEEPVLLALSRQKGWVLPLDGVDAARLADVMRRGARLYVETMADPLSPEVEAWLASHARLVATTSNARIFRLAGD